MYSEVNSNEYKMTGNILIAFKLKKRKKKWNNFEKREFEFLMIGST